MKIKNTLLTILTFVLLVISAFDTHNASAVAIESNLYLPWSYTKDAMRTAGYHEGYAIDFVLSPNGDRKTAPILAVQDGNVVFAQDNISTNCKYPTKCTANIIVIRHTNGRYSWYYHLKYKSIPPHLKPSKSNPTPKVSTGEVIAIQGNTGSVGDPSGSYHLHFYMTTYCNYKNSKGKTTPCYPASVPITRPLWTLSNVQLSFMLYDSNGKITNKNVLDLGLKKPVKNNVYTCPTYPGRTSGVTFFTNANCIADKKKLLDSHYIRLGADFNDKVSSISVAPGWSTLIYQDETPNGNSLCVSSTQPNLSKVTYPGTTIKVNDTISSIQVMANNSCLFTPESPKPALPLDSVIVIDPNVTFTWNPSSGATEYYLEYAGPLSGNSGWTSATTFPVSSLPIGAYTWHVKARNAGGESPWSETRTFTVQPSAPPAPTLDSPFDNTTTTQNVSFTWNESSGATEYYLEYGDGISSGNSGWINATTFTVNSLPVGTYTWRVKARNGGGESLWSQTWTFTVQPPIVLPDPPTLLTPSDNATTGSDVLLTWQNAANATEYYAEYSGPSSGNSGWITGTSFTITSLSVGTYTWHVKAQNSDGESSWSASWTFTVLPPAPSAPTLTSPANNSTPGSDVAFSWDSITDATEYYIEYSGTATGNSGWITATTFTANSLPVGTYAWQVKARNAGGESPWSESRAFTIEPVIVQPIAPTLLTPANNGTTGGSLTFAWQSVDNATEYYFEYSGTASGNSGWIGATSFPVTSLPVGSHTWHVKARNSAGESPWSESWTFTVLPAAPNPPTLATPNDGATIVNTSITFTWNSSAGATEYYIEYTGPASGNSGWLAATNYQASSLATGAYTWRVKARNSGGESEWSTTRTVNYQTPPAQITITTPTTLYPTFSTTNCPTSNWMRSTNNLGHYYYLTQNNNVNPWAPNPNYGYWKGTIPVAGYYKVEFYLPSHGTFYWCGTGGKAISANTTDAHYQIYTSGTTWTKVEKAQSGGNTWISLGNFYLTAGNYNIVKLIDSNHQTSFSQLIFFSEIRITWVSQ